MADGVTRPHRLDILLSAHKSAAVCASHDAEISPIREAAGHQLIFRRVWSGPASGYPRSGSRLRSGLSWQRIARRPALPAPSAEPFNGPHPIPPFILSRRLYPHPVC